MTTPNTRTILVTVSPDLLRNQEQFVDNPLPTVAQELGQAGWLAGGGRRH